MRLIIRALSACFLLFALLPAYGQISAQPYHPAQPITVVSESLVPGGISGGADGILWRITPETCDDGSFCLGFSRAETGHLVCRLVTAGKNAGLYLADGTLFSHVISANGLTLFPGFSVPCDVLPVTAAFGNAAPGPEIIEIRRKAGESTFIEQFQFDRIGVTIEDALTQGWIREPAEDAETLVLIQVRSLQNDEFIIRQLWVPGDAWWLYEETPYRRSWQLR